MRAFYIVLFVLFSLCIALSLGCGDYEKNDAGGDVDTDSDTDVDTDIDGDSDGDSDADSDSDGDTDTSGDVVWAKRAGGNGVNRGTSVAAFTDGSFVVSGYFEVEATFGPGEANETVLTAMGERDLFVAKFNPDGTLVWAKQAGGEGGNGDGWGITVTNENSTVVTGVFRRVFTFGKGEVNEVVLSPDGSAEDIFVAKYGPDGTLAWAKKAGGAGLDESRSVAALVDGSVFVTGFFSDTATFGLGEANEKVLTAGNISDAFFARYNPDGTLSWVKQALSTKASMGYGIAVLPDGSSIATGDFSDEEVIFGQGDPNETVLTSSGLEDIFLAKYNPDSTLVWATKAGGSQLERGRSLALLPDGSSIITGDFEGSAIFGQGEANETVLNSTSELDMFIAKYDPEGTLSWAKKAGGNDDDKSWRVAVTADGSAVVVGDYQIDITFGKGELNETHFEGSIWYEIFVAKYNPDGTLSWAKRALSVGNDSAMGVAALEDGSSLVTGVYGADIIFGQNEANETYLPLPSPGEWRADIFVTKYNP